MCHVGYASYEILVSFLSYDRNVVYVTYVSYESYVSNENHMSHVNYV